MKTLKLPTPIKLIAMSLITISCLSTSCTSLQQTTVAATDDLYYTPNAKVVEQQNTANNDFRNQPEMQKQEEAGYQEEQSYPDDRYLRLKVANRYRWDAIDDFGYWNDPRYNYAYYPSYYGWNSWYSGIYGNSWYNPFGISMGLGWGGYSPFIGSYYNMGMGWGFDDFAFGGMGYGMGYGIGYGWGGFGYGGWNPYFASYWNPYASYYNYYGGGLYAGIPGRRVHYQDPRATQTSATGLAAYRNASSSRNFNNVTNTTNGTTRYTSNANLNNNFGSLIKRVVTANTNTNYANSWDRPARSFNSNNNSNQYKVASTNNNTNTTHTQSSSNSNAGGRSGGYNSTGSSSSSSGRAPRNN